MGSETSKCFEKRKARGDFEKYLRGKGLDIGSGGDCLRVLQGTVDPWDLSEGNAEDLAGVRNGTYEFVYSSHCLEHMRSVRRALSNWVRVLKPGGVLYLVVPDFTLYEKNCFPSRMNGDHKQSFSMTVSRREQRRESHWNLKEDLVPLLRSLGIEVLETVLEDDHYDRSLPDHVDQTHFPETLAQLCLIGRKSASRAEVHEGRGPASLAPLKIYTGILGQIGDIVMFTPTARRLKELFPNSTITFAVSRKYREAGELVAGLPYVDRLFVVENYFERMTDALTQSWFAGWPVDLRGDDEVEEQRRHDLVFETRPRYKRMPWWEHAHQVEESANRIGVPGPIDLRTEIAIPSGTRIPPEAYGKIVIHNDPAISKDKAWDWDSLGLLVHRVGPENVVLLGGPGPAVDGVLDLRGKTSLAQAAATIAACECYVGIDSGLMWIAASLQVPAVGLYGTTYIPAYGAIQPLNPNAEYLQVEGGPGQIPVEAVLRCVRSRPRGRELTPVPR